jgi:hypothetical protein
MKPTKTMTTIRGGALLALCLCASRPAATLPDDATPWFQSRTQALWDAVADGRKEIWERTLDVACTITNEDGDVLDKDRFLRDLQPLPPGSSGRIKVRGLTVRMLGAQAAVVHYWLDESENVFDQQLQTTYVETDVYRRGGDGWLAVAMQVTVVPRDLAPIEVDTSGWPGLTGEYRLSEKATSGYHVWLRDGALYGGKDPASATRLIPLAPLVFFQQGSIHMMVFVRDPGGRVSQVRELHKYNEVIMKRVTGADPHSPP